MRKKDIRKNDKELARLFKSADKEMYRFDWEENCEYSIKEFVTNRTNVFIGNEMDVVYLSKVADLFPQSKIVLLGTHPILNVVYN